MHGWHEAGFVELSKKYLELHSVQALPVLHVLQLLPQLKSHVLVPGL
jgi:hypothetical protein